MVRAGGEEDITPSLCAFACVNASVWMDAASLFLSLQHISPSRPPICLPPPLVVYLDWCGKLIRSINQAHHIRPAISRVPNTVELVNAPLEPPC